MDEINETTTKRKRAFVPTGRLGLALLAVGGLVVGASGTAVWAMASDNDHEHAEASAAHDGTHERDHGIAVHDSTGDREPTEEEEQAADEFYDDVATGTERYEDIDVAIGDGYLETSASAGGDGPIKHYMLRGGAGDADELDPEHPDGLVYYVDENQATLIGVVFTSRSANPPQPGGPLTVWHDHSPSGCPEAHPDCPAATGTGDEDHVPKMLHVWLFEDADRFAHGFVEAIQGAGVRERGGQLPFDV